jgi:iron complex outermembrane receptor protein
MPRRRTTWAACALLGIAAHCAPATAQDLSEREFLTDFPTILSASRLRQNVADASHAVTVIDQDTIRASGAREIAELFRLVPGFTVTYATQVKGVQPVVTYHGLGREFFSRLQVLIDGRSMNNATLGGVDWSDFPLALDDIERIEVIRGPSTAVHGIGAFLATINFVSKHPLQQRGAFAAVNAGSDRILDGVARYAGSVQDSSFRLTGQHQSDDGFPGARDRRVLDFATMRADWQLDSLQSLMLQAGATSRSTELGSGQVFDPARAARFETGYAQLKWERNVDADNAVTVQVYHYAFKLGDRFTTAPVAGLGGLQFDIDAGSRVSRTDVELQHNVTIAPGARFVWGASLRDDEARAPLVLHEPEHLRLARLFAHLEWRLADGLLLNAGAMVEHNNLTGTNVAPEIAVSFRLVPDHVLRLGLSRALRDPTLFEQNLQTIVIGPSGIPILVPGGVQPESIVSAEIGYIGQFSTLGATVEIKAFRDRLHDLIGLVGGTAAIPPSVYPNIVVNGDSATQTGVEGQVAWHPLTGSSVSVAAAHLSTSSSDRFASYSKSAPRNTAHMLATQRFADAWLASLAFHVQTAYQPLGASVAQPAFRRVDLRLARAAILAGGNAEIALTVENAFNARCTDWSGNEIGQRRAWLSFSVKL